MSDAKLQWHELKERLVTMGGMEADMVKMTAGEDKDGYWVKVRLSDYNRDIREAPVGTKVASIWFELDDDGNPRFG